MAFCRIKEVISWENCKKISCIPPVSVFDTKQGYWQKRKREWIAAGINSGSGRPDNLMGDGLKSLAEKKGLHGLTGTSIFDPVLCEIMYNWYCPKGGTIFDPFAGGSVRGIVAEMLGRHYIGIDLSEKQVDSNQLNADKMGVCPAWHCDDSRNADSYIPDGAADFIFTCPPYHNLEKYSTHPLDLSNMSYSEFSAAYNEIVDISCRKLKENSFAAFIVADIRDSKGAYRDFLGLTKQAFFRNGLCLYNESILLNQYGTVPMRAGKQFTAKRKTGKVHQNVLIFYKGDLKKVKGIRPFECEKVDLSKLYHAKKQNEHKD